jgi:hypothetical protein
VALCYWDNSFKCANLAFFTISLVQLAGRGSEVAVLPFRRLTLYRPAFFPAGSPTTEKVAKVQLWRTKLKQEQELTVFNHRDSCFLDFYFSMAHSMIMDENAVPSESLFPSLISKSDAVLQATAAVHDARAAIEAEIEENDNFMRSPRYIETAKAKGVSKFYKDMIEYLAKSAQYLEELDFDHDDEGEAGGLPQRTEYEGSFIKNGLGFTTQGITSHSPKRGSVQLANSHGLLNLSWVCYRAGWMMKAVHTMFDYLTPTAADDQQVGLVEAGWTEVVGGRYDGGRPPELDCLQGIDGMDYDKVETFRQILFCKFDNIAGASDRCLQRLLLASVVLRLSQFILFLKEHPKQKFGVTDESCFERNRFLENLKVAAIHAGIDDPITTLRAWSTLVEKDFVGRNYGVMPSDVVARTHGNEDLLWNPRAIGGTMHDICGALNSLSARILQVEQNQRALTEFEIEARQHRMEARQNQIVILNLLQQLTRAHTYNPP